MRIKLGSPGAWVYPLVVVGSLASFGLWVTEGRTQSPPEAAPAAVPVELVQAERRDIPYVASSIGTVQSLQTVSLRPQVGGVLSGVLFKEGQLVRKGALLATIDDRAFKATLDQARAEKLRNEAQLAAARLDLTRYRNLLDRQAISLQTVEQQAAQVEQLHALVLANEASIRAAELQLSFTRIETPIGGRAGLRRVDLGNLVSANDAAGIVTVTQLDPIAVIFTLPQESLALVRPLLDGATGADVVALDRDAGRELARGRLSTVDNQVDATTGAIRLKAEFPNPDGVLWPGQFVTVSLQTGRANDAIVVPPRAIRQGLQGPYLFTVRQGKAEMTQVKLGYQGAQWTVVTEGLGAGDTVVIDGQSRLKPGTLVRAVSPDPAPGNAPVVEAQAIPVGAAR